MNPWKDHDDDGFPEDLNWDDIVILTMGNGDKIGPIKAKDADWEFPGDPIKKYRKKHVTPTSH